MLLVFQVELQGKLSGTDAGLALSDLGQMYRPPCLPPQSGGCSLQNIKREIKCVRQPSFYPLIRAGAVCVPLPHVRGWHRGSGSCCPCVRGEGWSWCHLSPGAAAEPWPALTWGLAGALGSSPPPSSSLPSLYLPRVDKHQMGRKEEQKG